MVICPTCGKEVDNEKFCPNCGSAISEQNNSSNTKFCTNCGEEIDSRAELCPKCGVKQNLNNNIKTTKYCSNCGDEIDYNAEICPKCGVRQMSRSASSEKNEVLALVLSFLLPGLGHIYLGLTRKGLTLLIIAIVGAFLLFIPYIIAWVYGMYDSYQCAIALSEGRPVEDKLF